MRTADHMLPMEERYIDSSYRPRRGSLRRSIFNFASRTVIPSIFGATLGVHLIEAPLAVRVAMICFSVAGAVVVATTIFEHGERQLDYIHRRMKRLPAQIILSGFPLDESMTREQISGAVELRDEYIAHSSDPNFTELNRELIEARISAILYPSGEKFYRLEES